MNIAAVAGTYRSGRCFFCKFFYPKCKIYLTLRKVKCILRLSIEAERAKIENVLLAVQVCLDCVVIGENEVREAG